MDYRLALTVLIAVVGTGLIARWWWPDGFDDKGSTLGDYATIPVVCGVVAARVSTVLLDHPAGIASLREVMIIRGGSDFWIGVAAGVAAIGLTVKNTYAITPRLALIAPFGLVAYGLYHAGCVIQDGCPGPPSAIGLTQNGIDQRVFPVGLVGAAAAFAAGMWFMRRPPSRSPIVASAVVLATLVAIRALVSLFTPSLVGFPSRDQFLSLGALAVAFGLVVFARIESQRRPSSDSSHGSSESGPDGDPAAA